jgi:photosystem II stability/assembly factor-like uncharacterized protein
MAGLSRFPELMNAKPFLIFLAGCFSASSLFAQTFGWSQFPGSPNTGFRNDDIHFIDETNGWAAGGGSGKIYRTTDGGATWSLKLTKSGTHFRSIGFLTKTRGFAGNLGVGSYDGTVTDTNVLYETFDGGETWSVVHGLNEQGMKGFCAFHVLDSQHIYGGGRVRGPAFFVKSEDAGTNWTVVNLTAMGVMNGIMDVYFKDATNGFVVGMDTNTYASGVYHGAIAKTTDGGATWTRIVTTDLSQCYFWKMSWPTPEVGYTSLQQNGSSSKLIFYKTTDGGNTWVSNGIPYSAIGISSFYLQGIGFISTNEGWVGGEGSASPYANTFLHTMDGGATWTTNGYNSTRNINRIRFLNPAFGYASGITLHSFQLPLALGSQPENQWATAGATVNFSIAAYGSAPFHFQWQKDGTNILNATNSTLVLTNVARADAGVYSVFVSNSFTNLVSNDATLRVLVPQKIQSPENLGNKVQLLFGDADGGSLTTNDVSTFEVQASTNLSDWTPLTNSLLLTNGLILLEDAKDSPHKFYRVIER